MKSIANSLGVTKKRNPAATSLPDYLQDRRSETISDRLESGGCNWIGMLITLYSPKMLLLKSAGHRHRPDILTCRTAALSSVWNKSLCFAFSSFCCSFLLPSFLSVLCQYLFHNCLLHQNLLNINSSLFLNHLHHASKY